MTSSATCMESQTSVPSNDRHWNPRPIFARKASLQPPRSVLSKPKLESLQAQLASTPQTRVIATGNSPERAAYEELRRELATARATLSGDHPRVQALQHQVNQLRAQLRAGGTSNSGDGLLATNTTYQAISMELRTAQVSLEALRERQRGLADLAEKAHQRVEAFSGHRGRSVCPTRRGQSEREPRAEAAPNRGDAGGCAAAPVERLRDHRPWLSP